MPYINPERRASLVASDWPCTAGELNFVLTRTILGYWLDGDIKGNKKNYQRINDIIGALECAKAEFYRRVVVPYEETKRAENGDVF